MIDSTHRRIDVQALGCGWPVGLSGRRLASRADIYPGRIVRDIVTDEALELLGSPPSHYGDGGMIWCWRRAANGRRFEYVARIDLLECFYEIGSWLK